MARNRVLVAAAATVVAAATVALGVSTGASAAPSSKYYTVTAPTAVPSSEVPASITITLGNCVTTTSLCPRASQQYFGSALITIPTGLANILTGVAVSAPSAKQSAWTADTSTPGRVLLTNSGTGTSKAIAPGESLGVTLTFSSLTSGAYTFTTDAKQSNDFSGTGNDFLTTAGNTTPGTIGSVTVYVGYPDHLAFISPGLGKPNTTSVERYVSGTVQSYNRMCPPPSVGVYDSSNHLVSWLNGLSVTLSQAVGNPGLVREGSTTLSQTTSAGVATFGTSTCSSGLYATNLGTGFKLAASATWHPDSSTNVSLSTTDNSNAFDVLQYRRPCVGSCSVSFSGTHVNWNTNASGSTTNTFSGSFGSAVPPISCTSQLQDGESREGVAIDLDNHAKTVTLTFDKFIFNNTSNNGTPFWSICFGAPYQFPTIGGYTGMPAPATPPAVVADEYEGLLVDCGTVNTTQFPAGTYPCVKSRGKNAANEIIVVSIPLNENGDPRMF